MNTTATSTHVEIIPIEHATAVIVWGDSTFYTDPVGGAAAFAGQRDANIIFLTDIHGDHLSVGTLESVSGNATIIAPQAVKDELPEKLAARVKVLANGHALTEKGFTILAMPMYNLPESPDAKHVKGRGNGYVIEKDGFRLYIAGDTAGTPEMRGLRDIDIALVPMNLPYTMGVEEAASAVLDFAPKVVYPYHYRGPDGLADVAHFKELVQAGNPAIEVVLAKWYPSQ
jgi:L-ascorbate metabolism protein UlaG (beta-lactamase superfamily)